MSINLISKLYIGYFGRAGDPAGLDYWLQRMSGENEAPMSLADIAQSFSVQPESTSQYPFLADPSADPVPFLLAVYKNLFNRDSIDDEGLTYWTGQIASGRPIGLIIIDIISGAQGADAAMVENKAEVAAYYTEQYKQSGAEWDGNDLEGAKAVLSGVTADPETVAPAKSTVDAVIVEDLPTYSVRATEATADEGQWATFVIETTKVAPGTAIAYTLTGLSADDVEGGRLTGEAIVGEDGTVQVTVELVADLLTEGPETLTITLDGRTASASITVNDTSAAPPVNQAPVAGEPAVLTPIAEDSDAITITASELLANVSDAEEDDLSVVSVTVDETAGELTANEDGTWSFKPAADFNGAVEFTVTVSDGTNEIDTTATLEVTPVNDFPVASAPAVLEPIAEGSDAITITALQLLANVSDVDGDELSVVSVTVDEAQGELIANEDGTWSFTPAAGFNGTVEFTVAVSDGTDQIDTTATLVVTAVNDAPVASAPVVLDAIDEDSDAITITASKLLANVTDAEDDELSVVSVTVDETAGELIANEDGTWSFKPAANFNGTVEFTVTVSDGTNEIETSATLEVTPVNDFPVASAPAEIPAIEEDSDAITITAEQLLAKVSDVDGDELSVVSVTVDETQGELIDNEDGTWSFKPAANFNGTVEFTVTVSDGQDQIGTTATLEVTPVNDFPVASGPAEIPAIDEDSDAITITAEQLLAKVSDVDGDELTVVSVTVDETQGELIDNEDGTWSFKPAANFNGTVEFTVIASDGQDQIETSAILEVTAVNDAPVPGEVVVLKAIAEDSDAITITAEQLLANVTDIEEDELSVASVTVDETQGELIANEDGTWSFKPAANFNGTVEFTVTVSDGTNEIETSATLEVTPVNDFPVASAPAEIPAIDEDSDAITITAEQLLAKVSDVDGDELTVVSVTVDENTGELIDNEDGTWSFKPAANFNGTVEFTVNVSDGQDQIGTTATLEVTPVNDAPVAGEPVNLGLMQEDAGPNIIRASDLLGGFTDIDNPSEDLEVVSVSVDPAFGAVTDNEDGTWSFTPAQDYNGTVTLTVIVSDGTDETETTATLEVAPVNDAPVAGEPVELAAIDEDSDAITITAAQLLVNADDVDGDTLSVKSVSVDPALGELIDNEDGTWSFKPAADYNGSVSFDVIITDGEVEVPTTATLEVTPVNDAPVAGEPVDLGVINEDSETVVLSTTLLLSNTTDIDNDREDLKVDLVTVDPTAGVVAQNQDGDWTFKPARDFIGTVTFTVTVSDGIDQTETTATLEVAPVNDAPVAGDPVVLGPIAEDTESVTILASQLVANADDVDGDTITVKSVSVNPTYGTVVEDEDGNWSFTPALNYNGTVTFDVIVTDGELDAQTTATMVVNPVNDAPVMSSGYGGSNRLADTAGRQLLAPNATVADPENNFVGGSLTVTASSAVADIRIPTSNFYLANGKLVVSKTLVGTSFDQAIGTVTSSGTSLAISFTSNLVNANIVQQLLRGITIGDAAGNQDLLLTVTLKDGDQAESKFDLVYDVSGETAFSGLTSVGTIEVSDRGIDKTDITTEEPFSLFGPAAVLNVNGAKIDGATIEVSGGLAGDQLQLDGTDFRFIQTQQGFDVAYFVGNDYITIGTATATPAAGGSLLVTLNANATDANIDLLLQNIQVDASADLGERTFGVTFKTADTWTTVTNSVSFTVAPNLNEIALSDLSNSQNYPIAINGKVVLTVDGTSFVNILALIADGDIVVSAENNVMEIKTTADAEINDVTGLELLGDYTFEDIADDLTVSAEQADGRSGTVSGSMTIVGVERVTALDLSKLVEDEGTIDAVLFTGLTDDASVTFTGNLGEAALELVGAGSLVIAASIADGKTITSETAGITITGLDGEAAYDFTGVKVTGIGEPAPTADVASDTVLNDETKLGDVILTVASEATLTLTAAQANGRTITGAGNVIVTDFDGSEVDLSGISVVGSKTVEVAADLSLNTDADLGGFDITVAPTATLTLTADQATGRTIDGEVSGEDTGSVTVTALGDGVYDLSKITGDKLVAFVEDASVTLDATTKLGLFSIQLTNNDDLFNETFSLTLTADQANGLVIEDGDDTGNVTITGVTAATDLTGISVGGTITAGIVADTDVRSTTTLANVTNYDVANGIFLTLTAAQAEGKLIGGDGNVTVTNLGTGPVDLSGITVDGVKTLQVVDSLLVNPGTNLDGFQISVAPTTTLTLTAAQASRKAIYGLVGNVVVTELGADEVNLSGITVTGTRTATVASTVTLDPDTNLGTVQVTVAPAATLTLTAVQASNKSIVGPGNVTIADFGGSLVGLSGITAQGTKTLQVTSNVSLDGNADLGQFQVTVAPGATLTLTAAQASGKSIGGLGNVTITGFDNSPVDLSGITAEGIKTLQVSDSLTLDPGVILGDFQVNVAPTATLTLTADQASGKSIDGLGNVIISGFDGSPVDLSGITAAGTKTLLVSANVTLDPGMDLDGFQITVAPAATLTLAAAEASGKSIGGLGNVTITGFDGTPVGLSGITTAGTKTLQVSNSLTLNPGANLGDFQVSVAPAATLTLTADQATGKTIFGESWLDDTGSVTVTSLGDAVYDFSKITGGTLVAVVEDAGVFLNASTDLGAFDIRLTNDNGFVGESFSIYLSAAQADGRVIDDGNDVGTVYVTGVTAATDLTGIDVVGTVTAEISGSVDVSDSINLGDVTNYFVLNGGTLTLSSAQANTSIGLSGPGSAVIEGTSGIDNLNYSGRNWTISTLTIDGGEGNDFIVGTEGNDTIRGGAGADRLIGSLGLDKFVHEAADANAGSFAQENGGTINAPIDGDVYSDVDVILDFEIGESLEIGNAGLISTPNGGSLLAGEYMLVRGIWNDETGTFTVDDIDGNSTMVTFDADASEGLQQSSIVLAGVNSIELEYINGSFIREPIV